MAHDVNNRALKTLSNVQILTRNDTLANWNNSTVILGKGEIAVALADGSTVKNPIIRVGDGTKTWSQLTNAGAVITEATAYTAENGGKDRNHGAINVNGANIQTFELTVADTSIIGAVLSTAVDANGYATISGAQQPGYITVQGDGKMHLTLVEYANKLRDARTIAFADEAGADGAKTDATMSLSFDGSQDVTTQITLVDKFSDDTSKDYYSVRVDTKGRVLSAKEDTEVIATNVSGATAAKLGLVKSAYDDSKAANSDDNQGKVAIDTNGNMTVTKVAEAKKLDALHKITVSGDVNQTEVMTGTGVGFDGSADATLNLTLTDTGVASSYTKKKAASASNDGTDILNPLTDSDYEADSAATQQEFAKVTVDKQGRVVAGKRFAEAKDIQDFNDATQTVIDSQKTATSAGTTDAGKLVILNNAGKLDDTLIPALGIGQVYSTTDPTVLSDTAKKPAFVSSNNIQAGDIVIVTADVSSITDEAARAAAQASDGTYIYSDNSNSGNGVFVLIKAPATAVQTVNGHYGPNVVLDTDDIEENASSNVDANVDETAANPVYAHHRYFTEKRVADFLAKKASIRDYSFQDSNSLILDTDRLILAQL